MHNILFKWQGYRNEDSTWEPKSTLPPEAVVKRFEKELRVKKISIRTQSLQSDDGKQAVVYYRAGTKFSYTLNLNLWLIGSCE